jgi:hypothetical protein
VLGGDNYPEHDVGDRARGLLQPSRAELADDRLGEPAEEQDVPFGQLESLLVGQAAEEVQSRIELSVVGGTPM